MSPALTEDLGWADKLKGHLEIWDIPKRGPSLLLYASENVITDVGRVRAAELLAGGPPPASVPPAVTRIAIGDNGIVPGPPRLLDTPTAPDRSDTTLANEIARATAATIQLSVTRPNQLIYTKEFLTADGPFPFFNASEEVVNESGLFTSDNVMFARRTFPSIPFDVDDRLGLRFIWKITGL